MGNERRVVITGLGAITPLGIGVDEYWTGLIGGRSGVALVDGFDCSDIATRIAAQVKGFVAEDYIDRKEAKRMDRFAQFAMAASHMAFKDSGLTIDDSNRERYGTFIGSGIGGIATLEDQHRRMMEGGMGRVSPFFIPMMIANMATGQVARSLGLQGPSETAVTACATSTNSIGDAYEVILRGDADGAIAGGSEAAVTPISMAGFSNMRAMSRRNDDPAHASRPFDVGRDGFVLGEGCGIIVMEELETALARGARIYGELLGYGMSNDAYDMVNPAPEGAGGARAMAAALKRSKVSPDEVGYINAHGTSTPVGDVLEVKGIKTIFGEHAYKLAVSSTKSMTGHLLGAAGAIEAIATVLALHHGILPPTMNLETPDEGCDLDFVPNKAREQQVEVAMSNSFGFGGHNATIVMRRWQG
ncbi:MAG: Beta-ketoacyl synthase-like protein [Capsulimonas sp.]|jgi:3-oxoacyl-[acyl-carrier-protein] synthase II|nr:Beta-ketoacyl synthase-like protein [Capsulimonas sp.]